MYKMKLLRCCQLAHVKLLRCHKRVAYLYELSVSFCLSVFVEAAGLTSLSLLVPS